MPLPLYKARKYTREETEKWEASQEYQEMLRKDKEWVKELNKILKFRSNS